MHEMSVAMSIVQSVTDAVSSEGGVVEAVSVRVGAMSGVIPEALTFAWGAASGGTALAEARLEICLLYTSPSPRDRTRSRMPSSA